MTYSTRFFIFIATAGLCHVPQLATAQSSPSSAPAPVVAAPAPAPAPVVAAPAPAPAPVAAAPAPVAAAPAPVTAPTPIPTAQPVPPPGYVLVPIGTAYPVAPAPVDEASEPENEMSYDPSQPVPPGYHVENRTRRGLVIGGSITLGVAWAFSAMAAVDENSNNADLSYLVLPVVGPWLTLATGGASNDCKNDGDVEFCGDNAALRGLLFLDGLTQTAGAIMLATGLFYPTQRLVRNNVAVSFAPTPMGRHGYGLGAIGTF